MTDWWLYLAGAAALLVLAVALRWLWTFSATVLRERARELFLLQRERLHVLFFQAAAASGKPRGLRWLRCEWDSSLEFVRERQSGAIAALAGVLIEFEAIPGSDMEGLAAVGNLRNASAVFYYHRGEWQTIGKTLFNFNPDEALEHFKQHYERLS